MVIVVRRHLHCQLSARLERRRQLRKQRVVVLNPLQRRVREDHVQSAARELRDVAPLEPHSFAGMLSALVQHRVRAVHTDRLRRLRVLVQHSGQHAGSAAQVHHSSAGSGRHQRQQIVEWLLTLVAKARVLVGLPGVGWRITHAREPTNLSGVA